MKAQEYVIIISGLTQLSRLTQVLEEVRQELNKK